MDLEKFELIFWDFDGVIKESVSLKTDAFVELFQSYGEDVCSQIRKHHINNGGMSRFNKIPLYFKWANIYPTDSEIDNALEQFSRIVKNKVINSAWVPGVEEFLKYNSPRYRYVMVSATPQNELEDICKSLKIDRLFSRLYGSPISKSNAINISMLDFNCSPSECLMIGDMQADIDAAKETKISFIFRRHMENLNLNINPNFYEINDFSSFNY